MARMACAFLWHQCGSCSSECCRSQALIQNTSASSVASRAMQARALFGSKSKIGCQLAVCKILEITESPYTTAAAIPTTPTTTRAEKGRAVAASVPLPPAGPAQSGSVFDPGPRPNAEQNLSGFAALTSCACELNARSPRRRASSPISRRSRRAASALFSTGASRRSSAPLRGNQPACAPSSSSRAHLRVVLNTGARSIGPLSRTSSPPSSQSATTSSISCIEAPRR